MSAVDKAEIERELDAEWEALRSVVQSLSEKELQEPGVVEEWSVKDLLGHIAFWAQKAAGDLAKVTAGRPADVATPGGQEGTNEWNAREAAARKGKSLEGIRREWIESFEAARAGLKATPADVLDVKVKGWTMLVRFREDTCKHYREHAAQIRAWQRELETTEA